MTRAELAALVSAKLIADGASPAVVSRVTKPGFFVTRDGLLTLAVALGVVPAGTTIDDAV